MLVTCQKTQVETLEVLTKAKTLKDLIEFQTFINQNTPITLPSQVQLQQRIDLITRLSKRCED